MCGIVGCIGHENAVEFVVSGLDALEYRGYDSVGIAYPENLALQVVKSLGKIAALNDRIPPEASEATTAIGHTRWASHGEVTIPNTHPHTNAPETIAVVHNGNIENSAELRAELESAGYNFVSETDTEVIPHLIDQFRQKGKEPGEAFALALQKLQGAYAVLACFAELPDTLYAARLGGPLVLGVNGNTHFASSDPRILADSSKGAVFLDDREIAELSTSGLRIWHPSTKKDTTRPPEALDASWEKATLGDFPHFMLKEIHESSDVVRAAISGRVLPHESMIRLGGLLEAREKLRHVERLIIVACGTSYHAGLIGERLIEEIAGLPVEVHLASEFKYKDEPYKHQTALLAISQSGETADTIGAIEKAKTHGMLTLGINNTPGSSIDRMTDAGIHCRAGQEVSVASTKAFTSQVAALAMVALHIGNRSSELQQPLMEELVALPAKIEAILKDTAAIKEAAQKYAAFKNFLFVGRGYGLASAMEGALKLKEISYIHAEGCGAGEMKHGTLALIDEEFPTMAIATDSAVYDKTVSNIQEIRARKGPVIALATEGNEAIRDLVDDVLYVPRTLEQTAPILNGIVLQLFAYFVALEKGYNVDRPRNLAKSVTVE